MTAQADAVDELYDLCAPVGATVSEDELIAMLRRNNLVQDRSGRTYTTIPRLIRHIRTLETQIVELEADR